MEKKKVVLIVLLLFVGITSAYESREFGISHWYDGYYYHYDTRYTSAGISICIRRPFYDFVVYNISNTSQVVDGFSIDDQEGVLFGAVGISDQTGVWEEIYDGGFLNYSVCAEGKCNIFYYDIPLTLRENASIWNQNASFSSGNNLVHQITPNYYYTFDYSFSSSTSTTNNIEYIKNGSVNKIGVSCDYEVEGYKFCDLDYLSEIPLSIKVLSPESLNTFVYIKNDNHNYFALGVRYDGEDYLLSLGNYTGEGVYTDLGLLHYVYCGSKTDIPDLSTTSGRTSVLIGTYGPNYVLDIDSICSSTNINVNINETAANITQQLSSGVCGNITISREGDTFHINGYVNSSDDTAGTIVINKRYVNNSVDSLVESGSYSVNITVDDTVRELSIVCNHYMVIPDNFLSEEQSYLRSDLLWRWENPTFRSLAPTILAFVFFLGIIPALFLFGRTVLTSVLGVAAIVFLLYYIGVIPLNIFASFVVILAFVMLMFKRWIL